MRLSVPGHGCIPCALLCERHDAPHRRHEIPLGHLGVNARLNGMAVKYDVGLRNGEHLTGGDPHLPFDEVDARDHLRDRMLYLQPGVISMKKNSSGWSSETRNSTVPAPL